MILNQTREPSDSIPVTIEEEMRRSYLDYAMSVIVSRALPDARDGLKLLMKKFQILLRISIIKMNITGRTCLILLKYPNFDLSKSRIELLIFYIQLIIIIIWINISPKIFWKHLI